MQQTDPATDLAKQRNRDAAERTLLAWVRTSLALIGFGFGIAQVIELLSQSQLGKAPYLIMSVRIFGMSFIALGVVSIIIALLQNRQEIKRITVVNYQYKASFPLAFIVASIISLIGLFTFLSILVGMLILN